MSDLLQVEFMLLNWQKTATGGAKVIFQVGPDDLDKFESLAPAKGGKGGQRFQAVLALLTDTDEPANLPVGPLCRLCVIWCRDPAFQAWLENTYRASWAAHGAEHGRIEVAKAVLCGVCGIKSRKDLDYSVDGRKMFDELIRRPYQKHLNEEGDK